MVEYQCSKVFMYNKRSHGIEICYLKLKSLENMYYDSARPEGLRTMGDKGMTLCLIVKI